MMEHMMLAETFQARRREQLRLAGVVGVTETHQHYHTPHSTGDPGGALRGLAARLAGRLARAHGERDTKLVDLGIWTPLESRPPAAGHD